MLALYLYFTLSLCQQKEIIKWNTQQNKSKTQKETTTQC
jgi:hypothetical protein